MATTKHLSNFYSFRVVPDEFRRFGSASIADLVTGLGTGTAGGDGQTQSLEQQVRAALAQGHSHFMHERYRPALESYQEAFTLLHRFLHPGFPTRPHPALIDALRPLDALDGILAAGAEVARLRLVVGSSRPIISPVDPPPELLDVADTFRRVGSGTPVSVNRLFYETALDYLHAGALDAAELFLSRAERPPTAATTALRSGGSRPPTDQRLQNDLLAARGVLLLARNERDKAQTFLKKARAQYLKTGNTAEISAVDNNLGVVSALAGNVADAGKAFAAAADNLPLNMGRTLHQPLNPGTASLMVRPMGQDGLSLLLPSTRVDRPWVAVASLASANVTAATRFGVLVNKNIVDLNLAADAFGELRTRLYEPRIGAVDLGSLVTHENLPGQFSAYLGHVYGFVLPISMGDCYFEMGEYTQALSWYAKARDYRYLNLAIEGPVVWLKTARCYLNIGHDFYRAGDKAAARVEYEKIVRLTAPEIDPASPLYQPAPFAGPRAQVQAIVAAPEPIDPNVHNPAVAVVVKLAQLNIRNIEAGIDFPLLSLEREQIPVFTFEYLQTVARYFAEHAIQAERTYINFKTSAEQEAFTRSMLENAVALEEANEALEERKVAVAEEQKEAMELNREHADLQLTNAQEMRDEYEVLSLEQIALDAEITYVGAPTTEYDFSGYGEYGISDGEHRVDEVLRTLTRRRRELSREFELDNMDRRIAELEVARDLANQQVAIADAQLAAAEMQSQIATLRRQQAEQQLALFDSQEFTPDLWNALANEIKAISRSYLSEAMTVARLMEQAYEFEVGQPVSIIKPNYVRNELSGLLAGDFLLKDIDSFTILRIVLGQKKQPLKEIISLADRFPVQFLRTFQKTGLMNFRTELADFDRNYPGAYQHRIKRIEVVVEGLIGREGIHGSLTNTGLCLTRHRNGGIQMRLLKPETMLLSRYRIGPDGVVFTPDPERLSIFEHSPVATSWQLELRPAANDLIFNFLTDVKLIVYYEAFYDADLKQSVLEELTERMPLTGRRTVALRYEMFDEFFLFQDTGEVRFAVRDTMLPLYHTVPTVRDLTILIETEEGESPQGLVVNVQAGAVTATDTTDADGGVASGLGRPLQALVGQPFLQEWVVSIPQAPNQARFDAGFSWAKVRNIIVVTEYDFVPRRIPGEPHLLLREQFQSDRLADFDVVDDAQATSGGPSNWVHVDEEIRQQSNIFGGDSSTANKGPVKPGTYLVRKADARAPALQHLLLTSRLMSNDNDGIGLVFRWQDPDNFYFFLMDSARGYRRLGKKVAGVFQELTTPAVDLTRGYNVGQSYRVRVRAMGTALSVYLDDQLVLSGADAAIAAPGRVGFYAWGNTDARFDDLGLVELQPPA